MDNISKILEAIREDGQSEADKISAEGSKRAEAVRKLYGEEARSEEEAIIKKAEKEAEEIMQRGVSQAGIESRSIKLAARRKALEKTYEMAGEKLAKLSSNEKLELYTRLIAKYGNKGKMTIILNGEDKKNLGGSLIKRVVEDSGVNIVISDKEGAFPGGIIIEEGETETNCTFEVMIGDIKKNTEANVAAMLFQ